MATGNTGMGALAGAAGAGAMGYGLMGNPGTAASILQGQSPEIQRAILEHLNNPEISKIFRELSQGQQAKIMQQITEQLEQSQMEAAQG